MTIRPEQFQALGQDFRAQGFEIRSRMESPESKVGKANLIGRPLIRGRVIGLAKSVPGTKRQHCQPEKCPGSEPFAEAGHQFFVWLFPDFALPPPFRPALRIVPVNTPRAKNANYMRAERCSTFGF